MLCLDYDGCGLLALPTVLNENISDMFLCNQQVSRVFFLVVI